MIDLIVSIVNHRNRELVEPLLSSIIANTHRLIYQIYVVDNASDDGSVEMIRDKFPKVYLLGNETPLGFATNHNQVLRHAEGRYFVLLNDDMLLRNDALDRLVAFMDANPNVGMVGCKLLNKDGSLQRSCWNGFPSTKTLFIDLFYLSKILPQSRWVREFEATLQGSRQPIAVDYILGACMLVRREVVMEVGGLDESYFMFLEETDWCYRIKEAGWKIYWVPEAEIIHYGQQSVMKNPSLFIPMLYQNYCKFARKHGKPQGELRLMKLVIIAGTLFRSVVWAGRTLIGNVWGRQMVSGYLKAIGMVLRA